jgi:hypothetical protein
LEGIPVLVDQASRFHRGELSKVGVIVGGDELEEEPE